MFAGCDKKLVSKHVANSTYRRIIFYRQLVHNEWSYTEVGWEGYVQILMASFIHSFIHYYSALEAGLVGTRAQSCDRYGSGTLHPGQVLGGSLPLLSPTFRRFHFRRQVPVRPQRRETF